MWDWRPTDCENQKKQGTSLDSRNRQTNFQLQEPLLSAFPGLIIFCSIPRLFGQRVVQALIEFITPRSGLILL